MQQLSTATSMTDLKLSLPNPNQLLRAIIVDVQERALLAGVRALGIIDKTVTGPFWRLPNTAVFNIISVHVHLLNMKIQLESWSQDASSLFEGEPLFLEEVCRAPSRLAVRGALQGEC